jgi:hypothetical protein
MPDQIQQLEIVPLRQAFPHEAHHFTVWLEKRIDALGSRIGLRLKDVKREVKVGDFSLDLYCADQYDRRVIIENQLEKSNHDHLGKLLVYLVNLEAKVGIWVVSEPRYEHEKVIHWLNQITPADSSFYLVRIEAVKIGTSPFAPLFTVVAGPDIQAKLISGEVKQLAERDRILLSYWEQLLIICKTQNNRFTNKAPSKDHWLGIGAGIGGTSFNYVVVKDTSKIELYIDWDQSAGDGNKRLFDRLHALKSQIEDAFGKPLCWDRMDHRRASRVSYVVSLTGLNNPEQWPTVQQEMVLEMERFDAVLRSELERAKATLKPSDAPKLDSISLHAE